ncbi:MAG: hypothetical protein LBN95_01415 [Prevotellaceae bacterium]|nr:hypothetical protein [Prevotellaceae bacterium]
MGRSSAGRELGNVRAGRTCDRAGGNGGTAGAGAMFGRGGQVADLGGERGTASGAGLTAQAIFGRVAATRGATTATRKQAARKS